MGTSYCLYLIRGSGASLSALPGGIRVTGEIVAGAEREGAIDLSASERNTPERAHQARCTLLDKRNKTMANCGPAEQNSRPC